LPTRKSVPLKRAGHRSKMAVCRLQASWRIGVSKRKTQNKMNMVDLLGCMSRPHSDSKHRRNFREDLVFSKEKHQKNENGRHTRVHAAPTFRLQTSAQHRSRKVHLHQRLNQDNDRALLAAIVRVWAVWMGAPAHQQSHILKLK
jgi:hypothetical protein